MNKTKRLAFSLPVRAGLCLAAGFLSMAAFTLSRVGYVGVSDPPLAAGSPVWILYALLLTGLYWLATRPGHARFTAGIAGMGLLFGLVNYFATTLFAYDTWSFLRTAGDWARAALCVLGQGAAMAAAFAAVCGWLERAPLQGMIAAANAPKPRAWLDNKIDGFNRHFVRFTAWRRGHRTLAVVLFCLLCWSPYLIVFYPGTIIWDMGEMLGGLYGLRLLSTWHPMLTTWLFGGCVWAGRLLHSDNLGAFLFMMLQTFALAYALADTMRFLRRLKMSRVFRLAALLFFGFTPIFGAFAQAVGKDTLYAAALLLFCVRTAETIRFGAPKARGWIAYAAFAVLACLLRSNGLYVVLGAAVCAVAFGLRGRTRLKAGGALAAGLALAFLFNGALVPALGIQDETASGLYSVCFQQSARTLRDHADAVTPEEYAGIDRVLDAANLPKLYESNISDPVKYTFKQYGQGRAAETEALTRYRQTWLSMLKKYPLTYLESFIAGGSGYYAFTPKIDAARTYHDQGGIRFVFETYNLGDNPLYLHTTQIAALSGARTLLAAYARGWRRVPLLEATMFCALYTWLLVAAAFSLARRRRGRELAAFIPALLSLGVCMLSPVNDYFRYFLPIAAMVVPLLALAKAPAEGKAL